MRDGATGSACTEWNYPTVALGLECTEAGTQMEKRFTHIALPQLWESN